MKHFVQMGALVGFLVMAVQPSQADVMAYPEKGQSTQKQEKDKYDCYQWAKKQTSFDPEKQSAGTAGTTPEQPKGGAGRGAAKGAAVGALGGAIGGDAGTGAAVGAGVGAVGGAAKRRGAEKEASEQAKQQQTQLSQQQEAFDQAQGTCLKGKGYSVG